MRTPVKGFWGCCGSDIELQTSDSYVSIFFQTPSIWSEDMTRESFTGAHALSIFKNRRASSFIVLLLNIT
jgi:hypothetical protein